MARGNLVWFNGKLLPTQEAQISLFTHALHYGTGAFEGIRAYKQAQGGGAVFRLAEHIDRLFDSFKILDFQIPYTRQDLINASLEVCRANGFEECYLRPIAFVGDGPLGVNPGNPPPISVALLTWEWGAYLGDHGGQKGARLKTSSFIRPHVNSSMTKGKISGQYVNSVLAKREALSAGYDEALLLDAEGYMTEGSGENLFIVRKGVIKTTPLNSILEGITRSTIIDLLRHQGHTVVEQRFSREEVWIADEVFLTGTAAEVTPVTEVDSRFIGRGDAAGKVGPLSTKLKTDYFKLVRGEFKPEFAKNWLTPIKNPTQK